MQSGYDASNDSSGLAGVLQGLFGDSGSPFKKGIDAQQPYFQGAQNFQNGFYQNGQNAMGQYNGWLQGMSDPSEFINKIMGGYSQSPWAKNMQTQSIRSGQNAASASGLSGSTPFAQQLQQNAGQISSQDQQNYLNNVLGVNTQYGSGLNNEMTMGQHAGDFLSKLFSDQGTNAGQAAYGQQAGKNQDWSAGIAGLMKLFGL